jgi:hypothetical protein
LYRILPFKVVQFSGVRSAAPVHLWHGEQEDRNVLSSVGHYVADSIPGCQATFFEDEGHFSVIYNHMAEILGVLVT